MKFKFRAKTKAGLMKEGKVEATSSDAAIQVLESNGLIPISVIEEKETPQMLKSIQRAWEGVGQKDLVIFFQEMAVLIEAKVPIVPALLAIGEETKNAYFKTIITELANDVEDGIPLSEGFEKHPDVFSTIVVNMVRSGEAAGNLQKSIIFVAENIEKNYLLSSKLKGALIYPAFVIGASVVIGILAMTIILPRITAMIKDLGVETPWYTDVVIALGAFFSAYWWIVIIILIALGSLAGYYMKSESGKREFDHIKLKIPVVGDMFRAVYVSRFADNLSGLLDGGIPVVQALMLVSEIVNNEVFEKIILESAEEVRTGGSMSGAFVRSPEVPTIVSQMIRVGEESGKTGSVLKSISRFYSQEVDMKTANLSKLIEPIIIVVLGVGVAGLVFSVLMPVYSIINQF